MACAFDVESEENITPRSSNDSRRGCRELKRGRIFAEDLKRFQCLLGRPVEPRNFARK